jgi:hypothetical protein
MGSRMIDKLVLEPEKGITMPLVVVRKSDAGGKRPLVVMVHPEGKTSALTSRICNALIGGGAIVVAADIRDTGETWYPYEGETSYINVYDHYIHYSSLSVGSSAMGMWAWDISRVIDYVVNRADVDSGAISVYGFKELGNAAIFAAVLDNRIGGAWAENISPTYVCQRGYGRAYVYKGDNDFLGGLGYLGMSIPNIMLRAGDMTHIMALAAPRKIGIVSPIWADGTIMSYPELAQVCRWPQQAMGAGGGSIALFAGAPIETVQQSILAARK